MNKYFTLIDFIKYNILPFGQLCARIDLLNSSMDKSWLLLLSLIPFIIILIFPQIFNIDNVNNIAIIFIIMTILSNIIPLLLIQYDNIKMKDKNTNTNTNNEPTSSVDSYILLLIIFKLLIPYFINDEGSNNTYIELLTFGLIFLILQYRQNSKCKSIVTSKKIIILLINTLFIYTMSTLVKTLFNNVMSNTFKVEYDMQHYAYIISLYGLFISYNYVNLINDNDNDYCENNYNVNTVQIFMLLISLSYYLNQYFIPICTKKN